MQRHELAEHEAANRAAAQSPFVARPLEPAGDVDRLVCERRHERAPELEVEGHGPEADVRQRPRVPVGAGAEGVEPHRRDREQDARGLQRPPDRAGVALQPAVRVDRIRHDGQAEDGADEVARHGRVPADPQADERPLRHPVGGEHEQRDLQPAEQREAGVEEQRAPQSGVHHHPRPVALRLPDQIGRRDHGRKAAAPALDELEAAVRVPDPVHDDERRRGRHVNPPVVGEAAETFDAVEDSHPQHPLVVFVRLSTEAGGRSGTPPRTTAAYRRTMAQRAMAGGQTLDTARKTGGRFVSAVAPPRDMARGLTP
jgi:hypothetical protein